MKKPETEAKTERYLVNQAQKIGGIAYKFTSPNRRFVPDRLCLFPGGITVFTEIKSPEGRLSSGQKRELLRIKKLGFKVRVLYTKSQVDDLINLIIEGEK